MNKIKYGRYWKMILGYLPSKIMLLLSVFLVIAQVICTLYFPIILMDIIGTFNMTSIDWCKIISVGAVIFFQIIISMIALYLMTYNSQYVIKRMRNELWKKVLHLPIQYFDRHESGEIMSRIANDTVVISDFITNDLASFISGSISMIGSLILLFVVDWKIAGLMVGLIPLIVVMIEPLNRRVYSISKETREQTAVLQNKLGRVLSNIRLVKASMSENIEIKSEERTSDTLFELGVKEGKMIAFIQPVTTMAIFGLLIIIFGYGSIRVANNTMSAGSFVAIVYYLIQIATPCMNITSFFSQLSKNCGALERVNEILNIEEMEENIFVNVGEKVSRKTEEGLRIENVSFGYKNRKDVLNNISFFIEQDSMVAVVGKSGVGKSTLFSLIERFYIPTSGKIYYDGIDIRSIPIKEWRSKIAYVEQNSPIVSGTIFDNLVYGLDKYDKSIISQAIKDVDLDEFINSLPKKYNTEVGEQGIKLSGGQKQRLAIARAMIRNPDILLLDEATAHLDSSTEEIVQKALCKLMENRITIVVAHRFSTIINADNILVLQDGRISGYGIHEDLFYNNSLYKELLELQINDYLICTNA